MAYRKISEWKAFVRRVMAAFIPYAPLRKKMRSKWLRRYGENSEIKEHIAISVNSGKSYENEVNLLKVIFNMSGFSGKKILLISHEASLTGAPMALFYMAVQLRDMGHYPVYFSLKDGKMRSQLEKENIPFLVDGQMETYDLKTSGKLRKFAGMFNVIIFNTFETRGAVALLDGLPSIHSKMMWIHECELSYCNLSQEQKEAVVRDLSRLDRIFCVGGHAKNKFSQYFPQLKTEELLYGLPDCTRLGAKTLPLQKKTLVFGILGTWEERKNQLGFVEAVSLLSPEQRKKARFIVLGNSQLRPDYASKIIKMAEPFSEILLLSELTHDKFLEELDKMDVVVSFSIDDPMPIVLTEALMNSKVVITTNQTGTASFIESGVNGFVVDSEDKEQLAEIMSDLIERKYMVENIRYEGRAVYQKYFTFDIFKKSLEDIVE